ncbi:MAG: FecR domain-containing protein [Bacteroidota bacterium]
MMFEEKDDTIMARWLAGELTETERAEFEASSEYVEYQRLAKGLQAFEKPQFDKEALRNKVWHGIENQGPSKAIRLRPLYYAIGIAASLLLLLGLFFNQVNYSTNIGEKLAVELPDGTKVHLNAKSSLRHHRFFWTQNKEVDLTGEAFFTVTKGDDFMVNTKSGSIGVLGTAFNVKVRDASFELHCYEGRVRYDHAEEQQQSYLNAGDAVELKGNILLEFKHSESRPLWQEGRSSFSNAELSTVMKELKVYYGISFDYGPTAIKGHFTGTFVHDDLKLALKSVFVPMGVVYELSEDQKTVRLNAR